MSRRFRRASGTTPCPPRAGRTNRSRWHRSSGASYDEPVQEIKVVHNLEHGGVIVQYGPEVSAQTLRDIVAWYRDDPNGLVVAPLPPALLEEKPELSDEIALTAWTYLQTCKRFNDEAFSNFVDLHRGNGPERFPVSV